MKLNYKINVILFYFIDFQNCYYYYRRILKRISRLEKLILFFLPEPKTLMSTRLTNTEINTNNSQNDNDTIPVQIIQKVKICFVKFFRHIYVIFFKIQIRVK